MSKITESARGEECTVRIPGVCNWNKETVVFAHLNGAGVAMKDSDLFGCYSCSNCHSYIDYGYAKTLDRTHRDILHLQAMVRTQRKLMEKGLVVLK